MMTLLRRAYEGQDKRGNGRETKASSPGKERAGTVAFTLAATALNCTNEMVV